MKLSDANAELIVAGIMSGNKRYARMRSQESEWLEVSARLAWSRPNYIDSGVVHEIKDSNNNEFVTQISKSGYAWKYVQFGIENALVVIKPSRVRGSLFRSTETNAFANASMKNLASVNDKFFEETDKGSVDAKQMILEIGHLGKGVALAEEIAKEQRHYFFSLHGGDLYC